MQTKALFFTASLALAATPLSTAQAAAPSTAVGAAFGNTVLSIYPDGRAQKVWMHPDGSWDGLSRRGHPLAGTWKVKNDQVCVKQSKPPVLPIAFCMPFPPETKIGASWPSKDLTGTPIQLKIVKGKVTSYGQ